MEYILIPVLLFVLVSILGSSVRVLNEYERAVVFRLGRIQGARGPGLIFLVPILDRMVRVGMRTVTFDVPSQDVISKDNVTIKVNAVVYFQVLDPVRAVMTVEDYWHATSQLSQTTLRSVLGQVELDELLSSRDAINQKLERILDTQTEPWGVKVSHVEVKQIDLPTEMQRAMARQAEAERERRAKIISAEGELQSSQKLLEAAQTMDKSPTTIQLRYLQTLIEMSSEKSTHTIVPLPLDFLRGLLNKS